MNGRRLSTSYTGQVLFYASVPERLDSNNAQFPSRFPDTFLVQFPSDPESYLNSY